MTLLHRLRMRARRLGWDVSRVATHGPADLITRRGVDLVFDVGANHGQYAQMLREQGYGGAIHSFEPLPAAFDALREAAARDGMWTAHNVALAAHDGTARINVAGNHGVSSSMLPMLPRHLEAAPGSEYVEQVEVVQRTLDSIWADVVTPPARPFLKLDVQGLEGAVLDGAKRSVSELVGMQIELSLVPLYDGAAGYREILDRVEGLGMRLVDLVPGFRDQSNGELLQVDAVFIRPS